MSKREYEVNVRGWRNSRTLIEDRKNGKVKLEIALSHNHCPTCADRVRHVTRVLANRNIKYTWEYPREAKSFIVLDHPGEKVSATHYLGNLLDLAISN